MTLTQAAQLTKRFILSLVIVIFLGITGFIGYQIWYSRYIASLPPKLEQPDTKFGTLPQPSFPPVNVTSSNFSYSLDTTTGGLPTFPKLTKVYFMPKPTATLLSGDKANNQAAKFNFTNPPEILTEVKYRYQDGSRILDIDLDTGNFIYLAEASSSAEPAEDDKTLGENFKEFLLSKGLLKDELRPSQAKVINLSLDNNLKTLSLWPENINKLPIVTPKFNDALVVGTVLKSARLLENYQSLEYTFWPVDIKTFATYPLKEATQAFEDLKLGKGVVIIQPPLPQVSITAVYLAYFEQESYTPYLQPVFVFEGPRFVAYVGAIKEEYISSTK
ncbi:hypothetical protein HY386_00550 [Candidatus Daviesbacteria bacterium]|nr:hypothetical protein [Candidatus Daviesbacteria bacterium]